MVFIQIKDKDENTVAAFNADRWKYEKHQHYVIIYFEFNHKILSARFTYHYKIAITHATRGLTIKDLKDL